MPLLLATHGRQYAWPFACSAAHPLLGSSLQAIALEVLDFDVQNTANSLQTALVDTYPSTCQAG